MKTTAVDLEHYCSKYEKTVGVLGKRWTPLILRSLIEHRRRFSEIRNYVDGVSDRVLSERLQELEAEGIVERRVLAERPVVVDYALTKKGADLRPVLEALQAWADRWIVAAAGSPPGPPATSRAHAQQQSGRTAMRR